MYHCYNLYPVQVQSLEASVKIEVQFRRDRLSYKYSSIELQEAKYPRTQLCKHFYKQNWTFSSSAIAFICTWKELLHYIVAKLPIWMVRWQNSRVLLTSKLPCTGVHEPLYSSLEPKNSPWKRQKWQNSWVCRLPNCRVLGITDR